MALDYSHGKPIGKNGVPQYDVPPAAPALATDVRDNGTVSSILNLTDDTTAIEIAATGSPVYLKWLKQTTVDSSVASSSVVSAAGSANFDHVIAADSVRRFVLPIATSGSASPTSSMVGTNVANGLYKNVALIGAASIATTQY